MESISTTALQVGLAHTDPKYTLHDRPPARTPARPLARTHKCHPLLTSSLTIPPSIPRKAKCKTKPALTRSTCTRCLIWLQTHLNLQIYIQRHPQQSSWRWPECFGLTTRAKVPRVRKVLERYPNMYCMSKRSAPFIDLFGPKERDPDQAPKVSIPSAHNPFYIIAASLFLFLIITFCGGVCSSPADCAKAGFQLQCTRWCTCRRALLVRAASPQRDLQPTPVLRNSTQTLGCSRAGIVFWTKFFVCMCATKLNPRWQNSLIWSHVMHWTLVAMFL